MWQGIVLSCYFCFFFFLHLPFISRFFLTDLIIPSIVSAALIPSESFLAVQPIVGVDVCKIDSFCFRIRMFLDMKINTFQCSHEIDGDQIIYMYQWNRGSKFIPINGEQQLTVSVRHCMLWKCLKLIIKEKSVRRKEAHHRRIYRTWGWKINECAKCLSELGEWDSSLVKIFKTKKKKKKSEQRILVVWINDYIFAYIASISHENWSRYLITNLSACNRSSGSLSRLAAFERACLSARLHDIRSSQQHRHLILFIFFFFLLFRFCEQIRNIYIYSNNTYTPPTFIFVGNLFFISVCFALCTLYCVRSLARSLTHLR